MHDTLPLLRPSNVPPLRRRGLATLQINLGYGCDQGCPHRHVNAGPYRSHARFRDRLRTNCADAPISVADHCYGRTAGQGSSCGGALGDAATP